MKIQQLRKLDFWVISLYFILTVIGVLSIFSANSLGGSSDFFSLRSGSLHSLQVIWIGISVMCMIIVLLIEERVFFNIAPYIYIFSLLLMVFTIFFGNAVNGSRSWLSLGFMNVQVVEFVKIATSLILARSINTYNFKISSRGNVLRLFAIIVAPLMLTLLQNETGLAIIYMAFVLILYVEGFSIWLFLAIFLMIAISIISLVGSKLEILMYTAFTVLLVQTIATNTYKRSGIFLLYVTGLTVGIGVIYWSLDTYIPLVRIIALGVLISLFIAFSYIVIKRLYSLLGYIILYVTLIFASGLVEYVFDNMFQTHQKKRILITLGLESDYADWGYHVEQSKIAISSGGFFGKGYLEGTQTQLGFVPEQTTDFIFCTIAEEWGFLGALTVCFLFFLMLFRVLIIANRQKSVFGRVYAYCTFATLATYIIINISMTLGIFPVVGIPLPFLSYGGSSILSMTLMLSILLSIDARR